jgi:nucleoside-diphosphate-sugar epimerase
MRVLVTGHHGYIGSILVPLLVERGHQVVGLDTDYFAACAFGSGPSAVPSLRRDLREVTAADLAGFDGVIHLAALSNDPLGNLAPELTAEINLEASARFASLAKQVGIRRFVFSSSCSTYGAAGDDFLDEQAAFNPVTPYGWSKVRLEQALHALADDDFSPVYMRNATAYGVAPLLRLDLVLNNLVAWAVTTGKIVLMSDGTPWRPIVHLEDISTALIAALEAPREAVHDQAFNIGRTAENYRILELAQIVAETVPGSEITISPGAGPDLRCYRVDCTKAETRLPGWRPRWDARLGARELYDAFRAAELRREDVDGARYIRLRRLQQLLGDGAIDANLRWQSALAVP